MARVRHLVLNSNKWFSAVSDYAMQLTDFLNTASGGQALYAAHAESPNLPLVAARNLEITTIPFLPSGVMNVLRSLRCIHRLILENQTTLESVWVFEGREHSVCALHKWMFPWVWKRIQLIRVRGQDQEVKKHILSKLLYCRATDVLVFASRKLRSRFPYPADLKRTIVQYYCARPQTAVQCEPRDAFPVDLTIPTGLLLGRFDPVKGHNWALHAFKNAQLSGSCAQLVFLGRSENISAAALAEYSGQLLGKLTSFEDGVWCASDSAGSKKVWVIDKKIRGLGSILPQFRFGLITSLNSEVICRVAVEFMFAGLPMISSTVGSLPEVLPPEGSLLCPPGDEPTLVHHLETMFNAPSNDPELLRMREASLQQGHLFSLSQFSLLEHQVRLTS